MTMGRQFLKWGLVPLLCAAFTAWFATPAWAGITVSKSFSPATIAVGGSSVLTISIGNSPPPGGTGSISFTDNYPANLKNAATPAASSSCGGTVTAAAGGASLSFSGGSLNGNNVCTVTVTVTSTVAGSYLNSTGTVTTAGAGNGAAATATLTVTANPPIVAKSFTPNSIAVGGASTLAVTLTNSNAVAATGVAFTDAYPSVALTNASPTGLSNSCGGIATAVAGASSLSLNGGTIAANSSCTVSVTVTSAVAGGYLNSTGPVVTGNVGTGTAATATLTVVSSAPSGFNAFETGTAAGSVSGVIRTKVAASAFGLDVVALKTGGAAVETAFAGDVKLELVDASAGAGCGAHALIRNLGTLTFTATDLGRKTLAGISEPNAWPNARIRMTYPATGVPTIIACSTDNFAIRPASFGGVAASDADSAAAGAARALDNTAASGGVVHKAGQPFRIAATAYNAVGVATSNYAGTPVSSLTACVLPVSGCTLGALSTGAWSTVSGTATTDGASYSEVGAFAMKLVDAGFAAVDAADGSTAAEMTIESAAVNVGRFVPDHFELTTASTPKFKTFNDTTCGSRSFTYIGQPFGYLTLPEAMITAKNAAGGATTNYAGALWKLAASDATQTYVDADVSHTLDTGLVGTPVLTETGSGAGTLKANATDEIAFARPNPVPPLTPPAPFPADITLTMSIQDIAENGVPGNGIIDTTTPAVFPSILFDSGNDIRFGRLILSNAHGSELLDLPVPIETQYWNGSGFVRNTADSCTRLVAANVALSGWKRDLNACETSVSLPGLFKEGRGNLKLSKPGVGNTGSVNLTLQLGATASGSTCVAGVPTAAVAASQTWLQGRWTGAGYDQDPTARASFGLYRGSKSLIYLREMY
ncbi:MAG: biosis protein MshQ [Pseudomonadota bacterium]|nr:biosis protein MshQ [Pseudomonadota bacterium]